MKNFFKRHPLLRVIIMALITVILIAVIAIFVSIPERNTTIEVNQKNPNIKYAGNGILEVSGNNSTELKANLAEFNWMNGCRMNTNQPFFVSKEGNKTYVLLAINDACARNFK